MNIEKLLTDKDLCRVLGISRVSSWRLRRKGALRFLKLEKGIRYTPEHVKAFIASRESEPSQQPIT